jgi:dihydropyrimidinase
VVDPHVHIGWPDWTFEEDTQATTKAAASGGVTTTITTLFEPGDLLKAFREKKVSFEKNAYVDGSFHAGIFTEEHIKEIKEMASLGVTSFKFAIPYRGSEVVPPLVGIDDGIVFSGFQEIAKLGYPGLAMVHAENIELFFRIKEKFLKEGRKNVTWHDTRPNYCEEEAMVRCIHFSKVTDCPLYVVHMTIREGVDLIRKAKGEGLKVIAETCPQYLTLTKDEDIVLRKVNPPLRNKEDNEKLWEGIRMGIIECMGSDHASCARKHKKEFWEAIVGMAGIETFFPVLLSEGVNKGRISIEKLVELCCHNNAKTFGLFPVKGTIMVGSDADLIIVDLDKEKTIRADKLHHISDFSPYEGRKVRGWPVVSIVRGNVIMENGDIVGNKGYGKLIGAQKPINL